MNTPLVYNHMASSMAQQEALAGLTELPDTAAQLRQDLSSGSRVSVWRLLMWVVAHVLSRHYDLFALYEKDVTEMARNAHYGTARWFVARALRFQFGHDLILTERDGVYAVDDAAARIVSKAAVVELANRVVVKVARQVGAALFPLTPEQLLAVNEYFQQLRPPVQVSVMTASADRMRLTGTVVYDPQVTLAAVQAAVLTATNGYLRQLDFRGVMRITDLKAAMLAVPGVVDVKLDLVEVRTLGPFMTISRVYTSYAGHLVVDSFYPLTTTMAWQAGAV